MQKVKSLNSQNKFKIDNSFRIHILRMVLPSRGSNKRKQVPCQGDRKRFPYFIASVFFSENLLSACGPTFRKIATNASSVRERERLCRVEAFDYPINTKKVWMDGKANSFRVWFWQLPEVSTWKIRKLCKNTSFQQLEIKLICTQNGYGPTAQIRDKKIFEMKEIFLLHDNNHFDLITTRTGIHNHRITRNRSQGVYFFEAGPGWACISGRAFYAGGLIWKWTK